MGSGSADGSGSAAMQPCNKSVLRPAFRQHLIFSRNRKRWDDGSSLLVNAVAKLKCAAAHPAAGGTEIRIHRWIQILCMPCVILHQGMDPVPLI